MKCGRARGRSLSMVVEEGPELNTENRPPLLLFPSYHDQDMEFRIRWLSPRHRRARETSMLRLSSSLSHPNCSLSYITSRSKDSYIRAINASSFEQSRASLEHSIHGQRHANGIADTEYRKLYLVYSGRLAFT